MTAIEKGIPLPGRSSTRSFAQMEEGDSLFFPFPEEEVDRTKYALRIYARAYSWTRRNKLKRGWTVNIEEKEGTWGVRLWRKA